MYDILEDIHILLDVLVVFGLLKDMHNLVEAVHILHEGFFTLPNTAQH